MKSLLLPKRVATLFPRLPATDGNGPENNHSVHATNHYSAMTFLRHAVPAILADRGFSFSVNLDPDVLCVRAWDFSVLLGVGVLAGRPVGSNARTARWLQSQRSGNATADVNDVLEARLGLSRQSLAQSKEYNGGVLVFNNTGAVRVGWLEMVASYHSKLHDIIEGDQDLISIVLASEPTVARSILPTVYNYAYRRDRERLPYSVAHRLRHGIFDKQVVNVHFVADGKPWQQQDLGVYPLWLLAVRLHHLRDWVAVARSVRPLIGHASLNLQPSERRIVGPPGLAALAGERTAKAKALRGLGPFAHLVDADSMRRCRCFVRGLSRRDHKSNAAMLLLSGGKKVDHYKARLRAEAAGGITKMQAKAAFSAANAFARKQRQQLLGACGAHRVNETEEETRACNEEISAANSGFRCALDAHRVGAVAFRGAAKTNCTKDKNARRGADRR